MSDTTQKILIGLVSVFVGTTLGAALGWARDWFDRRRRRRSLATAVLYDLQGVEADMNQLRSQDDPATDLLVRLGSVQDAFVRDIVLFRPETVATVSGVHGCLMAIKEIQSKAAAGWFKDNLAHGHAEVKRQCEAGLALMGSARAALINEGGHAPSR
jgi:hypothetical protein